MSGLLRSSSLLIPDGAQAVERRHNDVHDDHVRLGLPRGAHRAGAVADAADDLQPFLPGKRLAQSFGVFGTGVRDEDLYVVFHLRCTRFHYV